MKTKITEKSVEITPEEKEFLKIDGNKMNDFDQQGEVENFIWYLPDGKRKNFLKEEYHISSVRGEFIDILKVQIWLSERYSPRKLTKKEEKEYLIEKEKFYLIEK